MAKVARIESIRRHGTHSMLQFVFVVFVMVLQLVCLNASYSYATSVNVHRDSLQICVHIVVVSRIVSTLSPMTPPILHSPYLEGLLLRR